MPGGQRGQESFTSKSLVEKLRQRLREESAMVGCEAKGDVAHGEARCCIR